MFCQEKPDAEEALKAAFEAGLLCPKFLGCRLHGPNHFEASKDPGINLRVVNWSYGRFLKALLLTLLVGKFSTVCRSAYEGLGSGVYGTCQDEESHRWS